LAASARSALSLFDSATTPPIASDASPNSLLAFATAASLAAFLAAAAASLAFCRRIS
jgi:hypothetical protein